jgi:hypothetical protein
MTMIPDIETDRRAPGPWRWLFWLPPLGLLIIGVGALALAKVSGVGGPRVHLEVVAPWFACLFWTWRWTLGWRGFFATTGLALTMVAAAIAGELVQVWLPLHQVHPLGVLWNLHAAVAGTILAAVVEWVGKR